MPSLSPWLLPGAVNWMWTARAPDLRKRFQRALDLALPLLASGCVTLWLAASGRILIGHFLTERELAIYAFDMRVAGAAVVVHQLVLMVWFARLYRMRTRQFDRFASLYLAGTALIALMITALFPLCSAFSIGTRSARPTTHAQPLSCRPLGCRSFS